MKHLREASIVILVICIIWYMNNLSDYDIEKPVKGDESDFTDEEIKKNKAYWHDNFATRNRYAIYLGAISICVFIYSNNFE